MTSTKKITSLANPDIKRIRALSLRKYREEEGLFIAEGLRHALEAAEAGWEFDTLVVEESATQKDLVKKLLSLCDCPVLEVPQNVMESLAKRDNAQTVLAVLRQRWAHLRDVASGIWIGLEEIRDPGNLGTIMRTADAVGATGIVLIENCCDPYSSEAVRASMGSFPHVRLVKCTRTEFLEWTKQSSFQIIGTHLKTDHDYRTVIYDTPLILMMGNEQAGLSEALATACTRLVKIPMRGHADSLNVSVAAAVMLYEIGRKS